MSINLVNSVPSVVLSSLKESVVDSFKSTKNQKVALVALAIFSAIALIGFGIYRYFKGTKAEQPVIGSDKKPDNVDATTVPADANEAKPKEDVVSKDDNNSKGDQPGQAASPDQTNPTTNQSNSSTTATVATSGVNPEKSNNTATPNSDVPASADVKAPTDVTASPDQIKPTTTVVETPASTVVTGNAVPAEEQTAPKPKINLDRKACMDEITMRYANHPSYKPDVTRDDQGKILSRDTTKLEGLVKFFEDKFDEDEGAILKDPIAFVNKWIAASEKEDQGKRLPEEKTALAYFRNKLDL